MITSTTNLNSDYQSLFEEIAAAGGPVINNLEQFFGNIQEIANIDKKFLRLPLDEPMFAIDANTRKITVPDDFKSNGLSVQGDHLAETVFFYVDRYFDFMDLNNSEIYINWKMGSLTGSSQAFIHSADIMNGYIVFGWSIDKRLTDKSGSLSFAVQFCIKKDDGSLAYNLNTLVSTINIKEGLVLADVQPISVSDDILDMLQNSAFGENDAKVDDAIWVSGAGKGLIAEGADEYSKVVNLETVIENGQPASMPVKLMALAAAGREAEISYFASQNALSQKNNYSAVADGEVLDSAVVYFVYEDGQYKEATQEQRDAWGSLNEVQLYTSVPAFNTSVFVAIEDGSALNDSVIYYVADGVDAYNVASTADIAAWGTDDQVQLYARYAAITVFDASTYIISAQGVKYDANDNKIGASSIVSTKEVEVPVAAGPDSLTISKVNGSAVKGYSFNEDAEKVVFISDGPVALEDGEELQEGVKYVLADGVTEASDDDRANWASDSEDKVQLYVNEKASLTAKASYATGFGALDFVWSSGEEVKQDSGYVEENENTFEIPADGEYKVSVQHFRNNSKSTAVSSDTFVASHYASPIEGISLKSENKEVVETVTFNPNGSSVAKRKATIVASINGALTYSQNVVYQWMYAPGVTSDEVKPADWQEISGMATNILTADVEGAYKLVVKNIFNGSVYTCESKVFDILSA